MVAWPRREDYIFAQREQRERLAVNRLLVEQGGTIEGVFQPGFGWSLPWAWLGLRIPHRRLLRGLSLTGKDFQGDVDVLGGTLRSSSSLEPNQIEWPPKLDYVTAAEFKVAYYDAYDTLKATGYGSQNSDRRQAHQLCQMGFDRVALVRLLVTEPVAPGRTHPWIEAGVRSGAGADEYRDFIRVMQDDPFGTVLVMVGAVPGKLEDMAGSLSKEWFHPAPENPLKGKASDIRKVVEHNLMEAMLRHSAPHKVPVVVLACSSEYCGAMYVTEANPNQPCPKCERPPR